jgi:hypothetical protein
MRTALTGRTHGCTDQALRREDSPCQLGAVHTWHAAVLCRSAPQVRSEEIRGCWASHVALGSGAASLISNLHLGCGGQRVSLGVDRKTGRSRVIPGMRPSDARRKQTPAQPAGMVGVAPLGSAGWVRGLAKERSDYLTPASRPVKDHFGLCSSITSARLRSRMRALCRQR